MRNFKEKETRKPLVFDPTFHFRRESGRIPDIDRQQMSHDGITPLEAVAHQLTEEVTLLDIRFRFFVKMTTNCGIQFGCMDPCTFVTTMQQTNNTESDVR
jgi:hypothetical protein